VYRRARWGQWDAELGPLSKITGNVSNTGGVSRIRGVEIQGTLTVTGSEFSMAFSKVASASIKGNMVFLPRNEFTSGTAAVDGQNTILVDNDGL
jgi:hypothetical protein